MSQNVLYFPYIRVPDNEWSTHVRLYWHQVGSLVPSEYVESTVADQFMTCLASLLSETEELRSTPITDQEQSLVNFSAPAASKIDWRQELNRLRPFILQDLLPVQLVASTLKH